MDLTLQNLFSSNWFPLLALVILCLLTIMYEWSTLKKNHTSVLCMHSRCHETSSIAMLKLFVHSIIRSLDCFTLYDAIYSTGDVTRCSYNKRYFLYFISLLSPVNNVEGGYRKSQHLSVRPSKKKVLTATIFHRCLPNFYSMFIPLKNFMYVVS